MPDNLHRSALGSLFVVILGLVALGQIMTVSVDSVNLVERVSPDQSISGGAAAADARSAGGDGAAVGREMSAATGARGEVWLADHPRAGIT
ncbi:MAG: hypothetical protein ACK5RS_16710, partial [Acidobacteriota bacterium]